MFFGINFTSYLESGASFSLGELVAPDPSGTHVSPLE